MLSLLGSKKSIRVVVRFPHCTEKLLISILPQCSSSNKILNQRKEIEVSLHVLVYKLAVSIAAQLCNQKEFATQLLGSFSQEFVLAQPHHQDHYCLDIMWKNGMKAGNINIQHHIESQREKASSEQAEIPLHFVDELANYILFKSIKVLGREMDTECKQSEIIILHDLQQIEVQLQPFSPFLVEQIELHLEGQHQEKQSNFDQTHKINSKELSSTQGNCHSQIKEVDYQSPKQQSLNKKKSRNCQSNGIKVNLVKQICISSELSKHTKFTGGNSNSINYSLVTPKAFAEEDDDQNDQQQQFSSTDFSSVIEQSLNRRHKRTLQLADSKYSSWLSPNSKCTKQQSQEISQFETPVSKKSKASVQKTNLCGRLLYFEEKQSDSENRYLTRNPLNKTTSFSESQTPDKDDLSYERFVLEMSLPKAGIPSDLANEQNKQKHHNFKDISYFSTDLNMNSATSMSHYLPSESHFFDFLESDQETLASSLESIIDSSVLDQKYSLKSDSNTNNKQDQKKTHNNTNDHISKYYEITKARLTARNPTQTLFKENQVFHKKQLTKISSIQTTQFHSPSK